MSKTRRQRREDKKYQLGQFARRHGLTERDAGDMVRFGIAERRAHHYTFRKGLSKQEAIDSLRALQRVVPLRPSGGMRSFIDSIDWSKDRIKMTNEEFETYSKISTHTGRLVPNPSNPRVTFTPPLQPGTYRVKSLANGDESELVVEEPKNNMTIEIHNEFNKPDPIKLSETFYEILTKAFQGK